MAEKAGPAKADFAMVAKPSFAGALQTWRTPPVIAFGVVGRGRPPYLVAMAETAARWTGLSTICL